MHLYSSTDSRISAYGIIALIAVLTAIAADSVTDALDIGPGWLFSAPTVAAAYGLLYRLIDSTAWRWIWLRRLGFIKTPVVEGVYEGQLVSSYNNTMLPIKICIDQSWTNITIRFEVLGTRTSSSYSIAANLSTEGHLHARLTYTYRNAVQPGIADPDMNDQEGTAEVVIDTASGEMRGRYFNSRGRKGTLTLTRQ
ncbi:hypothetical protein JIG36_36180 [Actinoplanes sp. LDG1-06]|uniref:CD-NTase-associated protein 15 domain-containing protein n=1 Tax=Paractinoplanes ovalisporus TaxID=2810368 RepID=A0ABS2AM67_9ACTN|nr:hypothetical protein [Actinoplanes ovalisporus]MBM2620952.1 hypothetical protein [Actinoplanes ovalisporus]